MTDNVTVEGLKQRLNNDVNDVQAAVNLGNYYYDQGEAAQAIVYYRAALDVDPTLPGVRTDLGAMYWRNDNLGLAEKAFRAVIAQHHGFGQAYVNLGLLLQLGKGELQAARDIWQQLLDNYPQHDVAGRARELLQETAVQVQ